MASENIGLIAILLTIVIISYLLRDSLSHLLKRTKSISFKSGKHNLKIDTEETVKTGSATIVRVASESIVTADEIDKQGIEIKLFSTDKSHDFYQECATEYDGANSEYLWETHRLIVREIVEHFPDDDISVIDLGGGTGRYIAIECMNQVNDRVKKWTNLDFSENMQSIFKGHMLASGWAFDLVNMNLLALHKYVPDAKYDLAILSFVLSSMKDKPDFNAIRSLLKPGGLLLVAEGDPIYTMKKNCIWPVKTDKFRMELTLKPINPVQIIVSAQDSGFYLKNTKLVKKFLPKHNRSVDYSYVYSFVAI